MQIVKKNLRQGEVSVKVESPEDLWHLQQVLESGDFVRGKTERKIKLDGGGRGSEDRKAAVVKKTVFLEVEVERVEFHKYSNELRLNGLVVEGPEDVPRGSHHTIEVDAGSVITIRKRHWPKYQLDKLNEAVHAVKSRIIIVVFDREEAIFSLLKGHGHEVLSRISGSVSKKAVDNSDQKNFYSEIVKLLQDYVKRFDPKNIIVASPSFWKEYLMKEVPDDLKKRITPATCSEVSENAISEVMKRPEVFRVMEQDLAAKELSLMEDILKAISKDEACYGIKECEEKVDIGAVKELVVSYEFLNKSRHEGRQARVERLLRLAEERGGAVHIISTEESDKKLFGLGGVAGVLRWKS
ncbi:mRNA surveillance protein pelota [Candidatus Woesearchaeota archaeon]|nr:mRNA surveillance protein pelota [Candidatus Woesearchaeota archaeon]